MADGPDTDGMIEIGDPEEEPTAEPSTPPVVIQYHERGGVPWMLIPPMLAISAVGSILLYHKIAPRPVVPQHSPTLVAVGSPVLSTPEPSPPALPRPSTTEAPVSRPEPKAATPEAPPSAPPEAVAPPAAPVAPPTASDEPLPTLTESPSEPVKPPVPPPTPRVQGLGFDPKALEADRKAEAPADPALAPARDDRDLPREVDPDLLPPDPREARRRQEQRKLELARRVDEERLRFHAELKAICGRFREDSAWHIMEMRQDFDLKVDPAAEKRSVALLGKTGKYAGADRRTRIELLRSLGFPEPAILDYLFSAYEKQQLHERGGPRTPDEAYYFAALSLLRSPPTPPPAPVARPVSDR